MNGMDGYSLCKSVCSPILLRPVHEKIVRERLPMGSAFYGERLRGIVYWVMVEYRVGDGIAYNFHWRLDRTPIHHRRVSPHPRVSSLMDAPTSNRRRIRPRSRPRTISCGLGRSNIGEQSDLHKLHPSTLFIKVLRSFFKSDRSPRPPVPPFPVSPRSLQSYSSNAAAIRAVVSSSFS